MMDQMMDTEHECAERTARAIGLDYADVLRELAECRRAQSWTPGAIRSRWVEQIERLDHTCRARDAVEAGVAYAAARQEAAELAAAVARAMVTREGVHDAAVSAHSELDDPRGHLPAPLALADTPGDPVRAIRHVVEWVRACGFSVDHAHRGERDGYVVTGHTATAYASMRTLTPDAPSWVSVDLITGVMRVH